MAGPRARPRAAALVVAAAAVFAIAALAVVLLARGGTDAPAAPARYQAPDRAFSVVLPAGWHALGARALRAVPSAPVAVLRRADGDGVVVVHRRPALARSSRSLTRALTAELARRFHGLAPVRARTLALRGGPAYVYTFARPRAARVQSIAIAPRRGRTYTLDAVTDAGAAGVAAQAGAILRSFETSDPVPRP